MLLWILVIIQFCVLQQWLPSNVSPFDKAHEDLICNILLGLAIINNSIKQLIGVTK